MTYMAAMSINRKDRNYLKSSFPDPTDWWSENSVYSNQILMYFQDCSNDNIRLSWTILQLGQIWENARM